MESSPRRWPSGRSWLYRSALPAVILLATAIVPFAVAQFAGKSIVSKGPRAIGLIQLTPNGKGRLYPVAIMIDGKFYDAGSYKASPVPMALDFGIVYEGFKTGSSQGLLTITQPGQFTVTHTWIAEGTWLPAGTKPPELHKKAEIPVIEDRDAPPKLHRGDAGTQKTPEQKPETAAPAPTPASTASTQPAPEAKEKPAPVLRDQEPDDPNRPVLRRGKPVAVPRPERDKTFDEPLAPLKALPQKDATGNPIQWIPAISDAGGPDPRPYSYDIKPAEEVSYRAKMLDLANAELRAKAKAQEPSLPAAPRSARKAAAPAKFAFDDVKLRIFDLSNSNEPVLVLSATTKPTTNDTNAIPEEITLVARTNLEGELHRLFFQQTDSRHLEIYPRIELVDAVDADGDGRGELLFRRTSDAGSSFAIYRATADKLWPLFEGTP